MKRRICLFPAVALLVVFLTLLGCDGQNGGGCNGQSDGSGDGQSDGSNNGMVLYPANNFKNVNPDVHLKITFPSAPPLGNQGTIRVYDASNDKLVDELDLSIPPGPKNNRMPEIYHDLNYASLKDVNGVDPEYSVNNPDTDSSHVYQQNYIGGDTDSDAYHFFPVLINGKEATICLHNNHLEYNKTYYVQIDSKVFPFKDGSFAGITGKGAWTFSTKTAAPAANAKRLVVSADGSGDFDTVQGAIDFIPESNTTSRTIFVNNGIYEEIVYFRNKKNMTLLGESREEVVIRYANNGVFNPSSGHNRRSVFGLSNTTDINLINLSIISVGVEPAQAEGLCVKNGEKTQVRHVTIIASGDALQADGTVYLLDTSILGYGDNVLTTGALFFEDCELGTTYGPHVWPRNPKERHGAVFLNSRFYFTKDYLSADYYRTSSPTYIARNPYSTYPYAEVVLLNCTLEDVPPAGWSPDGSVKTNTFLEYNSVDANGRPIDVSQRISWSKQLTMPKDATTIANYSNPAWVLGGWNPVLPAAVEAELSE